MNVISIFGQRLSLKASFCSAPVVSVLGKCTSSEFIYLRQSNLLLLKMEMRKGETFLRFECFPFVSLEAGTLLDRIYCI